MNLGVRDLWYDESCGTGRLRVPANPGTRAGINYRNWFLMSQHEPSFLNQPECASTRLFSVVVAQQDFSDQSKAPTAKPR